jgi:excisionase family DNA binding protein
MHRLRVPPRLQVHGSERKAEAAMEIATTQRSYFTYEEASQYTNVSAMTLWRAVRDGRLRPAGPGRAVRFHRDELDRFMYSRGR